MIILNHTNDQIVRPFPLTFEVTRVPAEVVLVDEGIEASARVHCVVLLTPHDEEPYDLMVSVIDAQARLFVTCHCRAPSVHVLVDGELRMTSRIPQVICEGDTISFPGAP